MASWTQTTMQPLFVPPETTFFLQQVETCPKGEQVVYSPYHNSLLIRSKSTIYRVSLADETKEIIYASSFYDFKHIDVSDRGEMLLLMDGTNDHVIKIFHKNFFNIKTEITTVQSVPITGLFTDRGKALVGLELTDKSILKFIVINFVTNTVKQNVVNSSGSLIKILPVFDDRYLAFTTSGEVFSINPEAIEVEFEEDQPVEEESSLFSVPASEEESSISISSDELAKESSESSFFQKFIGVEKVHDFEKIILQVGLAGKKVQQISDSQTKMRIFVGSRPWSNDRWDSGEVETPKTSVVYGGGNNLKPGQKYFLHVLIHYLRNGWSAPQISEFIVPKYEEE